MSRSDFMMELDGFVIPVWPHLDSADVPSLPCLKVVKRSKCIRHGYF